MKKKEPGIHLLHKAIPAGKEKMFLPIRKKEKKTFLRKKGETGFFLS